MNSQLINFKIFPKAEKSTILKNCKGKNTKGIFLLYNESETEQVPFLAKILAAVQLDMEQDVIAFSCTETQTFSLSDINESHSLKKAIIFGFHPQHIGLQVQFQKYQLYSIGGIQYLFADSLTEIESTKAKKGLLWGVLQKMFV